MTHYSENDSSDSKMTQNDPKNMNVNIVINVYSKSSNLTRHLKTC